MFGKIADALKIVQALSPEPKRWMPPDVIIYISKYMEQHPEKKLTRRLERKLKREFYRSLRSSKK